jgi:hypothetical protein
MGVLFVLSSWMKSAAKLTGTLITEMPNVILQQQNLGAQEKESLSSST